MTSPDGSTDTPAPSKLLRALAVFLFLGAGLSVLLAVSDQARSLGMAYQAALVVASAVSAAAAFGLWKHRKWGAWIYIGLTVLNQPFLFIMGWWVWAALVIPGIVIALIMLKYQRLK